MPTKDLQGHNVHFMPSGRCIKLCFTLRVQTLIFMITAAIDESVHPTWRQMQRRKRKTVTATKHFSIHLMKSMPSYFNRKACFLFVTFS
jgi:hypothetical protein